MNARISPLTYLTGIGLVYAAMLCPILVFAECPGTLTAYRSSPQLSTAEHLRGQGSALFKIDRGKPSGFDGGKTVCLFDTDLGYQVLCATISYADDAEARFVELSSQQNWSRWFAYLDRINDQAGSLEAAASHIADFLEVRLQGAGQCLENGFPYHNPANPYDVDGDGYVTVTDSLVVASELRRLGAGPLPSPQPGASIHYVDVNRDGSLTVNDALEVTAELRRQLTR